MTKSILKKYFPSGKFNSLNELGPREVARMIIAFLEEDYSDFSEAAFYEFITNAPNIDWAIEISDELNRIDLDPNLGVIGQGLRSEQGKKEAYEIALRLAKAQS